MNTSEESNTTASNVSPSTQLARKIIEQLSTVIDPELQSDVMSLQLVENLFVGEDGSVSYTFRPTSFACPYGVNLAMEIKKAIASVKGVTRQEIHIEGFVAAKELEELLN
ncbi:MAG: metal-sulfur cluster assembly factor [Rectinema subterraneum]|jgi:metal-sulfur cluster biosynthetic enzyme